MVKEMKIIYYLIICYIICTYTYGCHKNNEKGDNVICHLTVSAGDIDRNDPVASVPLDEITFIPDSNLVLYEITGKEKIKTDIQLGITAKGRYMHWILPGNIQKGAIRHYDLEMKKSNSAINESDVSQTDYNNNTFISVIFQNGGYEFIRKGKKVLKYNTEVVEPPEGVDSSYRRSGFINPLYSPDQTILTRIPDPGSDHLHHYGLWNAWKKVKFRGDEIDFFAPQFGQGTVRHVGVVSINEGPVFSSLQVLREHITWQNTERETIAMSDLMDIKVYNTNKDYYLIDIAYKYNPVEPFLIKEYRYAGFSFRATDLWTKENTTFFTSEGLNRDQADGERSRWCVVTGETSDGRSSIQFMSHPVNYNHPEPMRIWPSSYPYIGRVFINYNPVRNTDWLLLPRNSYLLRYRLIITKGSVNEIEAEKVWKEFSNPVTVTWK
jgi:hypothetical protein